MATDALGNPIADPVVDPVVDPNLPATPTTDTTTGIVNAATPWPTAATYEATTGAGTTSTYTPAPIDPATTWDVTADQTVAGQVSSLIAANSPLQQQAATRADQQVNSRGLLNSSMAVGAGQAALYDAAIPIATADANRYGSAAGYNADTANKFTAAEYDAANQAGLANAAAENTQLLNDQAALNAASSFNANATNDSLLATFSAETQTALADIEANYKALMQTSASAADLQSQTFLNIFNISNSTTMDQAAKDAAVENQLSLLETGLGVIGAIGNLDLGSLLTFDGAANDPVAAVTPTLSQSESDAIFGAAMNTLLPESSYFGGIQF